MRRLESTQLKEIESIARVCFTETKQPDEQFDFEHFVFAVSPAIDAGSMVLWVEGDPVQAFLLANYVPGLFGGKPSAYAVSRFVSPEFRGIGLGSHFMRLFVEEGTARGCAHFYAGHRPGMHKGFFEGNGFKHVEDLYRLDV